MGRTAVTEGPLRSVARALWVLVLSCVVVLGQARLQPVWAYTVVPVEGVEDGLSFYQVDFTWEHASEPDSAFGQVTVDYSELLAYAEDKDWGLSSGFINVYSGNGWVVQNLPVDPGHSYRGISAKFDLGASGPTTSLSAFVDFSPAPLDEFSGGEGSAFPVADTSFNAEGRNGTNTGGPGGAPAPGAMDFDPNGKTSLTWQTGHPSVEQDKNQCGPGAFANSLQWLEDTYKINVPHDHVPGIDGQPPKSLVGQIDKKMNRKKGETVSDWNLLNGKLTYIQENDLDDQGTGRPPLNSIKHQGGIGIGTGDFTSGGLTSKREGGKPTMEWILRQLKEGEDVELAVSWDKGGGHWVNLVGGGYVRGCPWVAYVQDENQGAAGGTGWGGLVPDFSWLRDSDGDGLLSLYNEAANEVDFVVAESVTPELPPGALLLVTLIPAAWVGIRRRRA